MAKGLKIRVAKTTASGSAKGVPRAPEPAPRLAGEAFGEGHQRPSSGSPAEAGGDREGVASPVLDPGGAAPRREAPRPSGPAPMAVRLRRRRRLLQALALAGIAGIVGLVLTYLAEVGREQPVAPAVAETDQRADLLLEGRGVDFAIEREGRTVFHIRGGRVLQTRDDTVFLEEVTVALERDNGDRYRVTGGRATYNRQTGEAQLEGNVVLDGPGGLRMRTKSLGLSDRGQQAQSSVAVDLRLGRKLVGRADGLEVDLKRNVLRLRGNVRLDSLREAPVPFVLRAEDLELDRSTSQIRADGAVTLGWDRNRLRARRVSAVLSEDFETLRVLTAHWDVQGWFVVGEEAATNPAPTEPAPATEPAAGIEPEPDRGDGAVAELAGDGEVAPEELPAAPQGPAVHFVGGKLAVLLDERERPQRVDLEGQAGQAHLSSPTAEGGERLVEARTVVATFENGEMRLAETFGGTLLRETLAPGAAAAAAPGARTAATAAAQSAAALVREARSERGEARFAAAGELVGVTLLAGVDLVQGGLRARADRADLDLVAGQLELHGTAGPVLLTEPRGELRAPHVVYDQAKGLLTADRGVRARFERGQGSALLGTALGEGEGPIQVDSEEAFWTDRPRSFIFRGKVRAWQGDNVLVSDQLRGEESSGRFAASGGVRTIWVPTAEGSRRSSAGGMGVGSEPIEITARDLEYLQPEGHLIYTGSVASQQGARTLTCERLDVELGENRRARRLTCGGKVEMNDPTQGKATGEVATYDLGAKTVTVTGERVTLLTPAGNRVTGRTLVYDVAAGTARMSASASPASPEAPPPATPPDPTPPPAPGGTTATPGSAEAGAR
jgi:LPS export ABC transporter protein LptC/lipopolysaccharide transport protein LptA